MNTASLFLDQARTRPDAIAMIERARTLTFGQLDDLSARGAAVLRAAGLGPGSTALVLQPMSIDLYVALAALFRAGVVAVFVDPSAGLALEEAPDAFLGSPKAHLLRLRYPIVRRIARRWVVGERGLPGATAWGRALREATPDPMVFAAEASSPALMTFTSGSTGVPKVAVRTHGLLAAQHAALAGSIDLQAGQVDLTTLPIFALANLASGVTSLIPDGDLRRPGAIDPAPIIAQIRRHRPTRAGASPAFFERLLASGETFPEFLQLYTGGAPVLPGLLEKLQAAAPGARVVAVYGSTEAEPIAHIAWDEMSAADRAAMRAGKGLLAGVPEPCIDLRIRDGEIVVAGAHVLPGYWQGRGDEETKLRLDGRVWHRTGDCGYLDEAGRLWLLGRCVAKIVDARGELYPFAVECAARETPGVRRAALVADRGRRVLLLEPERGGAAIDREGLQAALAWAELDAIRIWRTIPMDRRHNAKVDYAALRRRL